jgi:flagellar FliL protein
VKKLLLPVIGGVGLLGLVAVAGLLGWLPIPGFSPRPISGQPPAKQDKVGPTVKLSPLIINLKDESGRSYLKTTIVLELESKNAVEEVSKKMSLLTDLVILTLGDKRLEEVKPPGSKETLKQELLAKMNQHFPSKTIKRVLFDELLYE